MYEVTLGNICLNSLRSILAESWLTFLYRKALLISRTVKGRFNVWLPQVIWCITLVHWDKNNPEGLKECAPWPSALKLSSGANFNMTSFLWLIAFKLLDVLEMFIAFIHGIYHAFCNQMGSNQFSSQQRTMWNLRRELKESSSVRNLTLT